MCSSCCSALIVLAVAACGDDDDQAPGGGGGKPQLTVSAAASLKTAFTEYGKQFPDADARFSFAGSDELAAQIEQGVKPDVYAAANTKLPDELYAKGLVEKPTVFAGNRLVLAVPAEDAKVAVARGPRGRRGDDRDRRRGRAGRLLHAHGAREAAGGAERGDPRQRALRGARRRGHHRQADAGRGRRRLPLHLRRTRDRRQAQGDRAARRRCSRRSPTASRWSRAPSSPSRPRRSSPGCSTGRARRR